MSRMPLFAGALVLASCASARTAPRVDAPTASPAQAAAAAAIDVLTPDDSPIALQRSMLADEYFWLRAKALEGEAPLEFGEALAAMQALRSDLAPDPTAWEDLEVPLASVPNARALVEAYRALPASRDVGGRPVSLRADALRVARAIERTEAAYRAGPFREHTEEIARAAQVIRDKLLPNVEGVLRSMESEMAVPGVQRPFVVTLVSDAPYPGVFAADARGRASASFVRVHGLDGTALVETVLHESLHALDELTVRSPTAMNKLRAALTTRGLDDSDPNVEMAVNTVTFAEAASLVRRYVDAAHRPLGESGFYTLFPPAPAIVTAWERHVEGQSLDATADAIANAVSPP